MPLQNFVDSSSSIPIISGAIKVKTDFLPLNQLIASGNPLIVNSKLAINQHFDTNSTNRLTNDQVNTYLSSSSLLHLLDGWTYFSHSVESLLKGDSGIAVHLSYYAELRATLSFLASEGIGIFNSHHFCLTSANRIVENPSVQNSGTHQFTWDVIEKWASSNVKPNTNDILKVFSVNNKNFEEWSNAFPYSSPGNSLLIVKNWLKKWNFDVSYFRNDREMRNNVSYRPQRFVNNPATYNLNTVIEKLGSIWELLEPNQSNRFHVLDKYLLRLFLQEIYKNLPGQIRLTNTLESLIIETLNGLGLNHDESLINFLKDTSQISHCLFIEANKDAVNTATGAINAMPVIARALLMLRISTGNISLMYQKAGITKAELNFLWEAFGAENGLWESGGTPSDFESLWEDIKDHIDDTLTLASLYSPDLTLSKIYSEKDMPIPFNYFKQFQRAGLWGITI